MLVWLSFLLVVHIATVATDRFNNASIALLNLLNEAEHLDYRDFRQPMQNIIRATLEEEKEAIMKEVFLLHKNITPTLQFLSALNDALLLILEPSSSSMPRLLPMPTAHRRSLKDNNYEKTKYLDKGALFLQSATYSSTTETLSVGQYASKSDQNTDEAASNAAVSETNTPSSAMLHSQRLLPTPTMDSKNDAIVHSGKPAVGAPLLVTPSERGDHASSSMHLPVVISTTVETKPLPTSSLTIALSPSTGVGGSSDGQISALPWGSDTVTTTSTSLTRNPSINPSALPPSMQDQDTKMDLNGENSTSNYPTDEYPTDNVTKTIDNFLGTSNYDYEHDFDEDFPNDVFSTDRPTSTGDSTSGEIPSNKVSDSFNLNTSFNESESENADEPATNNIPVNSSSTEESTINLIDELPTVDPTAASVTTSSEGEVTVANNVIIIEGPGSMTEQSNSIEYKGNSTYGFLIGSLLLVAVGVLLYVAFHKRNNVSTGIVKLITNNISVVMLSICLNVSGIMGYFKEMVCVKFGQMV